MIEGSVVRMHKGTVCYLRAPKRPYDKHICMVLGYDKAKAKWHVRLQSVEFAGKELLVLESSLKLAFSLLPSSPDEFQSYVSLSNEGAQGSCGRGLVAGQAIRVGVPIFEEPPVAVAFKSAESMHEHHAERWRAYSSLASNAKRPGDVNFSKALAAFEDLGIADVVPDHVRESAALIAQQNLDGKSPSAEMLAAHAKEVSDVLMRWACNQFTFENGVKELDPNFYASAIFANTSRTNHSCEPNMSNLTKEHFCKTHRISYDVERDGGVKIMVSRRAIAQGEPLTFNYGPASMLDLPLKRRRDLLLAKLNFLCGCTRCVREAAEEEAQKCRRVPAQKQAQKKAAEAVKPSFPPPVDATSESGGEAYPSWVVAAVALGAIAIALVALRRR